MKSIHNDSVPCLRSELDLFSLPPTQTAVDHSQWIEYNPVSSITSSSPIEFNVSGSGNDYIDMSTTLLEIKATITTSDGAASNKTTHAAPINNTLHSLFSQLDVMLNDVAVSSASTTYPYRAYIENHLNFGTDAKNSRLEAALYFIDDSITLSDPRPDDVDADFNTGLKRRHRICTAKDSFDMIGPLHADIFFKIVI